MKKWFIGGVMVWVLICAFSFSAFAAPMVLKAADDHANGYPTVEGLKLMAKVVDYMTNGQIKIKIYPGAQLGSEKETIEQTQLGAIDINRVSVSPVVAFVPKTAVLTLPYIFRSGKHMWKVLDGPIGKKLLDDLSSKGFIGLAYYDSGARNFYTVKKPILKPSDLKGLKIRVQKNPVMIDVMKALGASPVPMAFEEVYSALQSGVIDGAENNEPSYWETSHYEVAKYYSYDGHTRIPEVVLMSKVTWNKLTPNQRLIIKTAAVASSYYERYLWAQMVKKAIKAVKAAGCKFFYPNVKLFQEKVKPVYEKYGKNYKKLIKEIQAVK